MQYFFISDLHIGGDGLLNHCDFSDQLIGFLQKIAASDTPTELIIVGDAFGLWEFTELKGVEKLKKIIQDNQALFDQFKKTSATCNIILLPGNHDYEIACNKDFSNLLIKYGIQVEPYSHITKTIGEKKIWIEHGNQHDSFNHFENYGDPSSTPAGYYITSQFVGAAGSIASHGKNDWLKDIQSVYPTEHIPHWVFSNYFYHEMSPLLRYLLLPFLVLFAVSALVAVLAIIEDLGLLPTHISQLKMLSQLGGIGSLLKIIITINTSIFSFLLMLSVPLYLIFKDIKKTLKRYNLLGMEDSIFKKENEYINAAKKVFEKDDRIALFIYGHTHDASLTPIDNKAIINTGTWIKSLQRVKTHLRFLPDVYYPSYELSVFKVTQEGKGLKIEYQAIPKKIKKKLTFLQKLLTLGRTPEAQKIPQMTIID